MATRPYHMAARAEGVAKTQHAIMQATIEQFLQAGTEGLTLDAIARSARVTVQTVIRHFGSKQGLVTRTVEHARADILSARRVEPVGGVGAAIHTLLAAYEAFGDLNWQLLREAHDPAIAALLMEAREIHRGWLAQVFAAYIPRRGGERERRLQLLFGATDFYVWKLFRRDLGLSAAQTERSMRSTVEALCASFGDAVRDAP